MKIKQIISRQILDSRGNPTIEVDLTLSDGSIGRASVPSGASTGTNEAVELRDGGEKYCGLGVSKAIANITSVISPELTDAAYETVYELDAVLKALDGTENKSKLGANALLPVSLAFAKASAISNGQPLYRYLAEISNAKQINIPTPMFNIINGGKHAKDSSDFQEFMIVPNGIESFPEKLRAASEVFHTLGKILNNRDYATTVGDEGGYGLPPDHDNKDALDMIIQAIDEAGYNPAEEISIALDVAASELWSGESYNLKSENRKLSSSEMIDYYKELISEYPIFSIEDGLDEADWLNWSKLNATVGEKIMTVGDDLLVTNVKFIKRAIEEKSCNSVLVKPNQIGTLSETIEAVKLAKSAGFKTILSHRSGETEDTSIAHIAVGLGADYIKSGSLSRSERLAKYNELLRINEVF